MPYLIRKIVRVWRNTGLYARLLLPILLLILSVNVVQEYWILENAKSDAQLHYREELREVQRYLTPTLAEQAVTGDLAAVKQLLQLQVRERADLDWIEWQYQSNRLEARDTDGMAAPLAPTWFVRLLSISALETAEPVILGGEHYGVLRLRTTPDPVINQIWSRFLDWGKIFSVFVLAVFVLVNLILRGNLAALRQLSAAVQRFKSGNYSVRVPVTSGYETRAVASAFNDMAAELEALLQSLEESHRTQSEQLHFNLQLLAALPIPIYFKDTDGMCLGVNTAWENLYGISAAEMVGRTAQDMFHSVPEFITYHMKMDAELLRDPGRQTYEITIPSAHGVLRDVIYYKATFTNVDGSVAGLIGAIVDITERKQAQAALHSEKERV